MPDFAVSTKFLSKDEVTRAIKRMDKQAGKFGRTASGAFKQASRQGSLFGKIVKGILTAGLIRRGIGLLTGGIRTATTEFISFDDAIKSSTARFREIKVSTLAGKQAIADIGRIARKVGAETEFTATEAAKGMELFALAGLSVKQSISLLPGTVNLATAANTELSRAVEIGTKSLGAFGLMTKDTVQLQKNFTRVSDVMAATATSALLDIDEVFESVRTGGITFFNAGQSIETFNALVGKMADKSIVGEKAGTALRNVMLKLANPSREAASVLGSLGVTIADQKGDYRDIIDIIGDFEVKLKGMGNKNRAAALDIIFGKRSIDAFNAVLGFGSKALRNYRDDLIASGGASARMAEIMRGSLGKRLAALKSAAIEVGFQFIQAFEKDGQGAIIGLTESLREFKAKPVIETMKGVGSVIESIFNALKPLFPLFKDLIKVTGGVLKSLKPILSIVESINSAISILVDKINKLESLSPNFKGIKEGFLSVIPGFGTLQTFKNIERLAKIANIFDDPGREKRPSRVVFPSRAGIVPPNREDLARRNQEFNLSGQINLTGAPEGSTFELLGAPKVNAAVLGPNP